MQAIAILVKFSHPSEIRNYVTRRRVNALSTRFDGEQQRLPRGLRPCSAAALPPLASANARCPAHEAIPRAIVSTLTASLPTTADSLPAVAVCNAPPKHRRGARAGGRGAGAARPHCAQRQLADSDLYRATGHASRCRCSTLHHRLPLTLSEVSAQPRYANHGLRQVDASLVVSPRAGGRACPTPVSPMGATVGADEPLRRPNERPNKTVSPAAATRTVRDAVRDVRRH